MRRMALLTFGLALAAATPSLAGYRSSYADWVKLTDHDKALYVEGLNDGSGVVDTGRAANEIQSAIVRGRIACLNRQQVTAKMMAALIDASYHNDPSSRDLPPMTLYLRETYRICRQDIDAAIDTATNPNPDPTPKP